MCYELLCHATSSAGQMRLQLQNFLARPCAVKGSDASIWGIKFEAMQALGYLSPLQSALSERPLVLRFAPAMMAHCQKAR